MANSEAGERIGGAAVRVNRRRKRESKRDQKVRWGQPHSQSQSKTESKIREVRKGKIPEAKSRWDNLN